MAEPFHYDAHRQSPLNKLDNCCHGLEEGEIDSKGECTQANPCGFCIQCTLHPEQDTIVCPNTTFGRQYWQTAPRIRKALSFPPQPVSDLVTNLITNTLDHPTEDQHESRGDLFWALKYERFAFLYGKRRFSSKDMRKYFNLFDNAFFAGLLNKSNRIALRAFDTPAQQGDWIGYTAFEKRFTGKTSAEIRLRNPPAGDAEDYKSGVILQYLLETLLHEMLHCVVELMSCSCKVCLCKRNIMQTIGLRGHGPSWRRLAGALAETLNQTIVGALPFHWSIDLAKSELQVEHELNQKVNARRECEGALKLPCCAEMDADPVLLDQTMNRIRSLRLT